MQNERGVHILLQHGLRNVCVSTSCHVLAMEPSLALLSMPVEGYLPPADGNCSNYKVLRTRGPHRVHVGPEVANTYWETNMDDASNRQETSEGLQYPTALFFRIRIFSITFKRTLKALR